ncbi:hypothetical protein CKO28_20270 [Rhodovibrio sodomensis]|uniref:Calcineurin-like phosphoesterase domain-containing protein n=1 Tax=Rhodovibrio sodomensis TaxID=1088 RepID=A0ABS1DJ76_9PROT|nr:metallophosphoesterase [Rhodovibrio sodomensis]MBK1670363.1 hypothetical protein [Rhodovibrio sodomensis]
MSPNAPMRLFAHISDLHLPPLPAIRPREFTGKRLLGYVVWHRRRKYEHRVEVLDALLHELARQAPDHVVITGDLTNLGLAAEFEGVARWLGRLGPTRAVTLIPGNHDAYVQASEEAMRWALRPWLLDDDGAAEFPLLQVRGGVAFIGVSTAIPTGIGQARGRVGCEQMSRLAAILRTAFARGLIRVVVLHHPPQWGAEVWRRGLDDASALRAIIAREGADLVLHGHAHGPRQAELPGPHAPVPVYGVASASLLKNRAHQTGHYRLFRHRAGGHFAVEERCFDPAIGTFTAARV